MARRQRWSAVVILAGFTAGAGCAQQPAPALAAPPYPAVVLVLEQSAPGDRTLHTGRATAGKAENAGFETGGPKEVNLGAGFRITGPELQIETNPRFREQEW
jgi:hypothetical protein